MSADHEQELEAERQLSVHLQEQLDQVTHQYECLKKFCERRGKCLESITAELEALKMKIALIKSYAAVLRANYTNPTSIEHRIANEMDRRVT